MSVFKNYLPFAIVLGSLLTPATGLSQSFRTDDQGDWYHPLDLQEWIALGGDPDVLNNVLTRISNAEGPFRIAGLPDTQVRFGPGNWIYEFTQVGNAALKKAKVTSDPTQKRQAYETAMAYFHIASTPHTNNPYALSALKKAEAAFGASAALLPGSYEFVELKHEGKTFGVHYALPPGDGPFPLLINSNGSDQSKEMALRFYSDYLLPRGIAMMSVDMPGMGASSAFDVTDGVTDKLLFETAKYAKTNPNIDEAKIFAQGSSFGGNLVTRLALTRPELGLAGVIVKCGVLSQPFLAPAEAYEGIPTFTMDGVRTRLKLPLDAALTEVADQIRPIALDPQFDGPSIETPFIVVQTNRDPVSPAVDIEDGLMRRASNITVVKFDAPGHCAESDFEDPIIMRWLEKEL